MSDLSVAIEKLEAPLAQIVLASTLTGSIGTGLLTYIENTPGVTEAEVQTYANENIATFITAAIDKLPTFEQGIADIIIQMGLDQSQTFINQQINKAYTWAVSQLAGKANGQAILTQLATVPATSPNAAAA